MCVYRKLDVAIKRFRPQVVYLALSLRCRTSKFMTVNGIWANKQKKNVTDSATKRFNNIKKAKGLLISGILKTKKKEKLNQKNKSTICNATTSQTDEFALHWWRTLFRIQNSRKWPYLEHYSEHTTIGRKKRKFSHVNKNKKNKETPAMAHRLSTTKENLDGCPSSWSLNKSDYLQQRLFFLDIG